MYLDVMPNFFCIKKKLRNCTSFYLR